MIYLLILLSSIWDSRWSYSLAAPPQDVFRILGESVILPLKIQEDLKIKYIHWDFEELRFAETKAGEIVKGHAGRFRGRLLIPAGSNSLQIQNLTEEDSGLYSAYVFTEPHSDVIIFACNLHVLRRLPIPDVKANCTETVNGGYNATLYCSVKDGEGLIYTWSRGLLATPATKGPTLHLSMTSGDSSLCYICTAENRTSYNNNSVAISPWRLCESESSWAIPYCAVKAILTAAIPPVLLTLIAITHFRTRRGNA
ncbi:SLAM family member 9-like [Rhinatrema bivittatum]|uniref:SLAM family member 9-like n=1 Tax=Rhinatrema bivittatum TaxID=194408 RepID=UPI0011263DA3|nr:SLAM family member 9-like [Rhinatrema bivittatum]